MTNTKEDGLLQQIQGFQIHLLHSGLVSHLLILNNINPVSKLMQSKSLAMGSTVDLLNKTKYCLEELGDDKLLEKLIIHCAAIICFWKTAARIRKMKYQFDYE